MLLISGAAALSDVRTGRIPNPLIFIGLAAGAVFAAGDALSAGDGAVVAARTAGCLIPFAAGFPLFYFRMIGGGDIKLLMALGGLVGYPAILRFSLASLIFAAAISLVIMALYTGIRERLAHFISFAADLAVTGERRPYRGDAAAEFHFAVPVLMASILYAAGLIGFN